MPTISNRRRFLRTGILGMSLPSLLRLRANAASPPNDMAVIQIVLGGGPSHIDSYDPKPAAPLEFRGEFAAIPTNVPGVFVSEPLRRQARVMDKLTIIRSLNHASADHSGGTHWIMTGHASIDPTPRVNERPSTGSVTAKLRGSSHPGVPAYAALPISAPFGQAAYLGPGFNPFTIERDLRARYLEPPDGLALPQLEDRRALLAKLDRLERERDASGAMAGMDRFLEQAYAMVSGPSARRAFDLTREDAATRDRYGRTTIGQSCLLARRLVEAGVAFVTVYDEGWDHHTEVFARGRRQFPPFDAALASLVEDLHDRGLDRKVLVFAWGEFGRTPKVNGSGGRDHWPGCMSAVVAGGGLKAGQIIGASSRRAEYPVDRALHPEDLLRTVYHVIGINPDQEFPNESGRPLAVLNSGKPIAELF